MRIQTEELKFRGGWLVLAFCLISQVLASENLKKDAFQQIKDANSKREMFDAVNNYGSYLGTLQNDQLREATLEGLQQLSENKSFRRSGCDRLITNIYVIYEERKIQSDFWNFMSELLARDDLMPIVLHPAIHQKVGDTYYKNGYYHSAIGSLKLFVEYSNPRRHDSNLYCNALTEIALSYKRLGNMDQAFYYTQLCIDSATSSGNDAWVGIATGNMGMLFKDQGDFDKAYEFLKVDMKKSRENNLFGSQINLYAHFGKMAYAQKDFDRAKAYIDSADNLLKKRGFEEDHHMYNKTDLLTFKAKLASNDGNFERAFRILDKRDSIRDALKEQEYPAVDQSQFKLVDLHRKNLEIQLLESKVNNERLRNRFMLFGLISTVLLIIFLVIITLNRKKQYEVLRVKAKEIEERNELITLNNKTIRRQKSDLEASNLAKDKLFSVISHDLKSPILAIRDLFGLVEKGLVDKDELWEIVPEMHKNVNAVYQNTEQLLSWSRTQLKGVKTQPELASVRDIFEQIVELHRKSAENKGIVIKTDIQGNSLTVYADVTQVKLIISNLLINALKFSSSGSIVQLKAENAEDNMVNIQVEDHGEGMSPERLEEIKTEQPVKSTVGTDGEIGTGLGISITRQFLRANSGSIDIYSAPGVGTTASIWLPLIGN